MENISDINITIYLETAQKILTLFYQEILSWLSSPNTYYQVISILVILALTYRLNKLLKHLILNTIATTAHTKKLLNRFSRLTYPIITMILLSVAASIAEQIIKNNAVIEVAQHIAIIWLLSAIMSFVNNALLRTIATWILLPAILLQLFGWLEPVINYLDQHSLALGEIEVSVYTLIKAILIVSVIIWLGKLIRNNTVTRIRSSKSLSNSTKELLVKFFDITLYSVLFLIALNLMGIDLTALALFSGALGVGLGFGLQRIASNFVSGIILISEKSININDLVEMNDGIMGYVRKLGARASVIETFDGKEVMVPNEDFITSRVSNLTYSNARGRVDISVGVAYGSDLSKVYDLILEAADTYEYALKDEGFKPNCYLREYGDSSVNFLLTFWLRDVTTGRWRAKSDVMFKIWNAFKAEGIEIPFPQRDLHIRSGLEPMLHPSSR